jgi:hypothetical protein
MDSSTSPVIQVERGCPAAELGVGCACLGTCHELIDVVSADVYWRVVGERDEARRQLEARA